MRQRMSKAEQNCQTQSGPKHREKSSDFRLRLKAVSDVDEVTLDDRLFHTREDATGNERSLIVEWHIGGTTSVDVDADLRRRRVSVSGGGQRSSWTRFWKRASSWRRRRSGRSRDHGPRMQTE